MKSRPEDPLRGPFGAVLKFVAAAFLGGFVSLVVIAVVFLFGIHSFWQAPWLHILWIIPIVWGILGIFWLDRMLELGRKIFEDYFGTGS